MPEKIRGLPDIEARYRQKIPRLDDKIMIQRKFLLKEPKIN
jgi:hypothetical protein